MKSQELFRNELPYRARVEFCALESLADALKDLVGTCEALCVHARTEPERAEWGVILKKVRHSVEDVVSAITETMREPLEVDTYDAVENDVDFLRMHHLIGAAGGLGRLHIRTVGTPAHTNILERVADVYVRLVRLSNAHDENHRSKRSTKRSLLSHTVVQHPYS